MRGGLRRISILCEGNTKDEGEAEVLKGFLGFSNKTSCPPGTPWAGKQGPDLLGHDEHSVDEEKAVDNAYLGFN